MKDTDRPGWYVVCEDYTAGPYKTREGAERAVAEIEAAAVKRPAVGCHNGHRVEERS